MKNAKLKMTLFAAICAVILLSFPTIAKTQTLPSKLFNETVKENARDIFITEKPLLFLSDLQFMAQSKNTYKSGMGWDDMIIDFLYPSSGRTKYVQYVPSFGKNKMYWHDLDWKNYETDHISLFAYDPVLKDFFISVVEENYTDLSKTFKTESFDEKMVIYIYRDRLDFRQMNFAGIDADDIGGVTHDLKKWHNKIAFLFEGSKADFFEVSRHEMVHRFNMEQIFNVSGQNMLANPPIWFVEGTAVSFSIGWSGFHEWIARDAYYNEFLVYGILPEGYGTILPYVTGGMMINYIRKHYGDETINAIFRDSAGFAGKSSVQQEQFDAILFKYTGCGTFDLYEKTVEEFKSGLVKNPGDIDVRSPVVTNGILLDARDGLILKMEGKYLDRYIYLAKTENGKMAKEKKVDSDGTYGTEELEAVGALSATRIAYAVFNSGKGADALRIAPYSVKGKKIKIGKRKDRHFPNIVFISGITFVGEEKIAFVGLKNGLTNIYLYDLEKDSLDELTNSEEYIWGLDYSLERNEIVFSRESKERTQNPNKCDFNHDLYLYNLGTAKETKIVETLYDEIMPSWLGKDSVIFTTNATVTNGLAIYDLKAERFVDVGQVRIMAMSPKAIDENTVLFNSTNYLDREIHLLEIPWAPVGFNKSKTPGPSEEKSLGNAVVKNGALFVKKNGKLYPVSKYAAMENGLYFDIKTGLSKTENTIFSSYKDTPQTAESPAITNFVESMKKDHTIMRKGISPSGNFFALATNNRLNWNKDAKKNPVSIYLFSAQNNSFVKYDLKMKSTSGFHQATFIKNDYLVVKFESSFVIIDPKKPLGSEKHFDKVDMLLQNETNRLVVWRSDDEISVFDANDGSVAHLTNSTKLKNFRFITGEKLAFSEETSNIKSSSYIIYLYDTNAKFLQKTKIDTSKKSKLPADKNEIFDFAYDSESKTFVLLAENGKEKTKFYSANAKGEVEPIAIDVAPIKLLFADKGNVFFWGRDNKKAKEFVYSIKEKTLREKSSPWKAEIIGNHLVLGNKSSVAIYGSNGNKEKIIYNTAGFVAEDGKLVFSQWNGANFDVFKEELDSGIISNLTQTEKRDETNPYISSSGINYLVAPVKAEEKVANIAPPDKPKWKEGKIKVKKPKSIPFDVASGFGFGSMGYGGKFYLNAIVYLACQDLIEDSNLSLFYNGGINVGYNVGELSYFHRPSGNGARFSFDQYGGNLVANLDFFHVFRFNKFQRLTVGYGYRFQLLSDEPADYKGIGSVLTASISYSLDTTRHLLHGPQDGYRLYIGLEGGYNYTENALNNLDLTFAWRQYFNVRNLLSFAYRLEAGSSIGIAPTWFILGGNGTLRGIPIFSLWGNTYALASAEIRFDLIYYAGAVLKEPLTGLSSLLMAIFPQFGWYADVGTAFYYNPLVNHPWFNDKQDKLLRDALEDVYYPPRLYWSTGPFINLPYMPLGMILRFNFAVAGSVKGWNFWFGYNW